GQRKLIKSLYRKDKRLEHDLFIAEGIKLCEELIESEYEVIQVIVRESPPQKIIELADEFNEMGIPIYSAPKHKFRQLVKQTSPEGIIAVVGLKELEFLPSQSFIALDGVSDPGNVGTILRTADWYGIKQVFLGAESADQFGPKVVRSSMGSVFRLKILYKENLAEFLKDNFSDVDIFAADSNAKTPIEKLEHNGKFGIVFGSESHGLSKELDDLVKSKYVLQGIGSTESLNVAVSAGISLHYFAKHGK
ncbi:MAG: RNA methyltransferase, partial [Candidatus Kapaibacterium sp.]